ncbi:MAG: (deoxy)nucleoside triphosphate pyrophosphohydrolase [Deltaproteobacteria bacterium]|nr:(deoxy)nucleoside triphosphate pyrophosphohydrolase [Deltaproteobacteria bacterium]
MVLVEVAAGIIRDERGRYLIAQRPAGTPLAGLWEFPGGKRHSDESLEECLRRELAEELGASFHVGERVDTVVWTDTETTLALSFYRCLHERGAIEARVAQALAWVEPGRLSDYEFPPADRALVERLRADA